VGQGKVSHTTDSTSSKQYKYIKYSYVIVSLNLNHNTLTIGNYNACTMVQCTQYLIHIVGINERKIEISFRIRLQRII
jgi:hypothetical protein